MQGKKNRQKWIRYIFLFLLIIITISCENKLKTIDISIKDEIFTVEVARTKEQKEQGLMFRKELGKSEGMIFVYEYDTNRNFYMKNTYIPLSIAFVLSNGKIVQIENMEPQITTVEPRQYYRYALEVPQGTFNEIGVKQGDFVNFPPDFP